MTLKVAFNIVWDIGSTVGLFMWTVDVLLIAMPK